MFHFGEMWFYWNAFVCVNANECATGRHPAFSIHRNANMTKIAVTIPEAIEMSGLGRTSLYAIIKTGQISPRKYGKRTLIMVDELDKYIRSLPVAA